ncbi:LacI family DNA-binding transcriptional regulator [Streptomyces sp. B-S-A8]|uniref:LacI family DNA-binding transcriptional regulator n=1 Tax=Streptomyces solicavernae TaxID=3043614 RepID=A0ABT6RU61_9ACTN|nr:LacI family DNA-binding transcriptional regulator [Streptomyces sp. B-S-A8]MDI3387729.1 LacI family DNA-binding transcriptional regulator [Streptomyces sp. B-S-A8]
MAATLTDVAKCAEVALSTASRAFSDPGRLGPATLRKVLSAAQELGYAPPAARQAAPEPAGATVAVVVPDIAHPLFGVFVKAAQAAGRGRRTTVVLADTDFRPEREREVIAQLRDRADGLLLCTPWLETDELLGLCGATPVVLVNREAPGTACVLTDTADGLRQACEHLAALGHRRLAYVQGERRSRLNRERLEQARTAAKEAGLALLPLGWQAQTYEGGKAAAAGVLATGASAVLTHNDPMALGVVAGARALGARVPEDLSVVGVDGIPFAELAQPALTTVAVPLREAGGAALDLLELSLGGAPATPRTVTLPTQLVVRDTTGPAPAPRA